VDSEDVEKGWKVNGFLGGDGLLQGQLQRSALRLIVVGFKDVFQFLIIGEVQVGSSLPVPAMSRRSKVSFISFTYVLDKPWVA
jgi:hypothetical protein